MGGGEGRDLVVEPVEASKGGDVGAFDLYAIALVEHLVPVGRRDGEGELDLGQHLIGELCTGQRQTEQEMANPRPRPLFH